MDDKNTLEEQKNIFAEETHPINPVLFFFISLWNNIFGIVKWIVELAWSMVESLVRFFKSVGVGIYHGVIGFIDFFKRKGHQFKNNDVSGRISYGIFGFSALKNKQYTNGILFLAFEILYIVAFAIKGISSIGMLSTLGTTGSYADESDDFAQLVVGDNSIMILIYGLLWVLSIAVFLYIWNRSINNGYSNYRINHLLEYDEMYKAHLDLGKKLDIDAREAFSQGISYKNFKSSQNEMITTYLSKIENKEEKAYVKYLAINSIRHTYSHLKLLKRENLKLSRIENRLNKLENIREAGLRNLQKKQADALLSCPSEKKSELENKQGIRIEIYNNNTLSHTNKIKNKIKAQNHIISEYEKKYSFYIELQETENNQNFGKNNNYYNYLEALKNKELFYNHYNEFVEIYNSGLVKFEDKNEENKQEAINLQDILNNKYNTTNAHYNEIRNKKLLLKGELQEAKDNYKKIELDVKANKYPDSETRLLEAKSDLLAKSSRIIKELGDMPSDKNINALHKEELKESKRAYVRDKKYLRTNYTGPQLGMEEVINKLVVDYKVNYNVAASLSRCLIVKKNNEKRFLSQDEIAKELAAVKKEKNEYIDAHPEKYAVKFNSFIENVKSLFNEKFNITILLFPIIGIVLFSIVPLIFSIFIAFTNYSQGHQPPTQMFTWIGFENFKTIFAPDPSSAFAILPTALGKTLSWTLIWAVVATFSNYFLGIIVALMINKDGIKFKKLWRTIFITTIAVPQFISLLSIGTLLKDSGAIGTWYFNTFGSRLGFGSDGSASAVFFAKFIIILVNVWVGIPYTILSTTGILLNIPKNLYESAEVDGAGTVTKFTKITMPYILFVTGPYLITQFIGNFNNFNVIFFLTGGGPALSGDGLLGLGQTDLLITFIYKIVTSNNNPQYGIASTIGIVVFIICSFVSIVMYNKSGAIKEEDQFQ